MRTESTQGGPVVRPSANVRCVGTASSQAWPLFASEPIVVALRIVAVAFGLPRRFMRNVASAMLAAICRAMEGAIFREEEASRGSAMF